MIDTGKYSPTVAGAWQPGYRLEFGVGRVAAVRCAGIGRRFPDRKSLAGGARGGGA